MILKRDAEYQALLVEACNGAETVKALAVEQQMQRKWGELAAYVLIAFKAAPWRARASACKNGKHVPLSSGMTVVAKMDSAESGRESSRGDHHDYFPGLNKQMT